MNNSPTKISTNLRDDLAFIVNNHPSGDIFILTDSSIANFCYPQICDFDFLKHAHLIVVEAGDEHKNIDAAVQVWKYLSEHGATRKSLLINLGGGMITDLGGFVASTFKRGISYINISTTLLGAVDAATGGKTGINFLGLKNEIGVFNPADAVLIDVNFFKTLSRENLLSGYAEMVKHALIDSKDEWHDILAFNFDDIDWSVLSKLVDRSVRIKEWVVEQDPREQNIRKALNLGHTFGHAFETYSYRVNRPVLHGYAVMWGLLCELYLSLVQFNFPKEELLKLKYMIRDNYGMFPIACNDYEALYELMTHDKKNDSKDINFTLLSDVGQIHINQTANKEMIFEALDFYCNG